MCGDDGGVLEELSAIATAQHAQGMAKRGGTVAIGHELVHAISHDLAPRQAHIPARHDGRAHIPRR